MPRDDTTCLVIHVEHEADPIASAASSEGGCCAGKTPAPAAAPPKPEPAEAARKPPPGTSTKLVGHNPERRGSDPEMAF